MDGSITAAKVVGAATNVVLLAGKTTSSVLGLPMLGVGLALIDNIVAACNQIPIQKRKVKTLVDTCETLRAVLYDKALAGTLVEERALDMARELEGIKREILKIPRYSLLRRFLFYQDIGDKILEINEEVNRLLVLLGICSGLAAHIALKDAKQALLDEIAEIKKMMSEIVVDRRSRKQLQHDDDVAAQVRASWEVDMKKWRQTPEDIDPKDVADFEQLLHSLHLPKGVEMLTGEVSITEEDRYDAGIYMSVYLDDYRNRTVAVKAAKASSRYKRAIRRFSREVTIWARLNHLNILPIYGLIEHVDLGVCTVSPFLSNGNLFEYLQKEPNANRLELLLGAAEGLRYLHNSSICHGNVKCSNIVISDDGHALICDFKVAHLLDCHQSSIVSEMTRRTLTRWSAPEIIQQVTGATRPSDIYSFAMTVLETITMTQPYPEIRDEEDVRCGVAWKNLRPMRPRSSPIADRWLSDEFWEFLIMCWRKRPCTRPVIQDVVNKLAELLPTVIC
ncbi:kinase-like protein [Rickenella mellea]|uniref:Kinase-like protein n=1 Tax=Rickenella mellea TaxID=50990 RepID=A0A4Y7Q8D0_9AGAM|nr:kinase-like protein [Rickenella mellea]